MRTQSTEPNHEPNMEPRPDPIKDQEAASAAASEPGASVGLTPRDLLIPYILLAVSLQRAHGYIIEEYLRSLGFFDVDKSMLYRTLRQLEKDGLVSSEWEPGPSGPARRVYVLSAAGRVWLDGWKTALEGYRSMIDRFFDLYAGDEASRKQNPR